MLPFHSLLKLIGALATRIVGVFFLLALNLVLANNVTQEEFGRQMVFYTAVIFLGNIGTLGTNRLIISLAVPRELSFCIKEYSNFDFIRLISFFYLSVLFAFLLSSAFGSFNSEVLIDWFFVVVAAFFLSLTIIQTSKMLITKNTNFAILIQNSTIPAFTLCFYFVLPLEFFLSNFSILLLTSTFSAFILSKIYRKKYSVVFSEKVKTVKNLLVRTSSFSMVIFSEMYFVWGISLLTVFFISSEEYATLNVIQRLCSALLLILMVSTMITMPNFSSLKHSRIELKKAHFESGITCLLIMLPTLLLLLYFTEFLLSLFGKEYAEYSFHCRLFLTAIGIAVALGPSSSLLMMIGKSKAVNTANSIAIALSIPLLYFLTNIYALLGAVVSISFSFLISKTLIFCIALHYIYKARKSTDVSVD